MEKKIIKAIREGFKIALVKKLLKESSLEMGSKLTEKELSDANSAYNLWMGGKIRDARYGKSKFGPFSINNDQFNYIVEKAVEEFKLSGDKRKIQRAIAELYYPWEGSKAFNTVLILAKSRFIDTMPNRYKKDYLIHFPDAVSNAWTETLGNYNKFQDTVNKYTKESGNGIGGLMITALVNGVLSTAKLSASISKGGRSIPKSLGDRNEKGDLTFDIAGGIEDSQSEQRRNIPLLFNDFGQSVSNYFESKGKDVLALLARELFINLKSNEQIINDNPDYFAGKSAGDVSTMILNQVLAPTPVRNLAKVYARKYNANLDWLETIIDSKSVKLIQALGKTPESNWEEPKKDNRLTFENFIEKNMDNIIKEVYRRLNK